MNIKTYTAKLIPVKQFIVRYAVLLFIVAVVAIFSFMTLGIAHFSDRAPTQLQIDEKKLSVKVVKLDEASINKIKELQNQNISIESLFDNGRANPFE